MGRYERRIVRKQELAGDIEEGRPVAYEFVQANFEEGVVDDLRGGLVTVSNACLTVASGPVEQLIGITFQVSVEDRLAADKDVL